MHSAASRRRVLGLGAGLAASAWLPALANAQTGASALIARPIPHSGESLPVIGLGTSQVSRSATIPRAGRHAPKW